MAFMFLLLFLQFLVLLIGNLAVALLPSTVPLWFTILHHLNVDTSSSFGLHKSSNTTERTTIELPRAERLAAQCAEAVLEQGHI